jgi:hypothetical protein
MILSIFSRGGLLLTVCDIITLEVTRQLVLTKIYNETVISKVAGRISEYISITCYERKKDRRESTGSRSSNLKRHLQIVRSRGPCG